MMYDDEYAKYMLLVDVNIHSERRILMGECGGKSQSGEVVT